jgi:hypothetical protein
MYATYIPNDLVDLLKANGHGGRGFCYDNSGSLLLYSSFENLISELLRSQGWEISYALGILTPPPQKEDFWIKYDSKLEPHAWIEAKKEDLNTYWDLTLQLNSPTWAARRREFLYDKRYTMNSVTLQSWIRENYHDTTIYEGDLPIKGYHFPEIDLAGNLLAPPIKPKQ